MTGDHKLPGALSPYAEWSATDWSSVERQVRRLQMRIAKAEKEGKRGVVGGAEARRSGEDRGSPPNLFTK
jgi:hypothetical protein